MVKIREQQLHLLEMFTNKQTKFRYLSEFGSTQLKSINICNRTKCSRITRVIFQKLAYPLSCMLRGKEGSPAHKRRAFLKDDLTHITNIAKECDIQLNYRNSNLILSKDSMVLIMEIIFPSLLSFESLIRRWQVFRYSKIRKPYFNF